MTEENYILRENAVEPTLGSPFDRSMISSEECVFKKCCKKYKKKGRHCKKCPKL
ncbi:MAG: hypothetical protein NXI20_19570 [bacterium]|nr:hypothetical protein [bacterium]